MHVWFNIENLTYYDNLSGTFNGSTMIKFGTLLWFCLQTKGEIINAELYTKNAKLQQKDI